MSSKKSGFTVLEVIIAMTIIMIVSLAMFATINYSFNENYASKVKSFFIGESENYVASYYLGEEKYADAMQMLTGEEFVFGDDATIYYDVNLSICSENNSVYQVYISFAGGKFAVNCYKGSVLIYDCAT